MEGNIGNEAGTAAVITDEQGSSSETVYAWGPLLQGPSGLPRRLGFCGLLISGMYRITKTTRQLLTSQGNLSFHPPQFRPLGFSALRSYSSFHGQVLRSSDCRLQVETLVITEVREST